MRLAGHLYLRSTLSLLLFLTLGTAAAPPAAGQELHPEPKYVPSFSFEVASIRENREVRYESGSINPSESSYFVAKNLSAYLLTEWAYDARAWQIIGGPDWFRSVPFYIEAKSDASADQRLAALPSAQAHLEKMHMLRSLLEERFHLQTHWEMRDQPAYALVVSKSGSKLQAGGSLPVSADEARIFGNQPTSPIKQTMERQGLEFFAHKCSLDLLASSLATQMGREVVNQTGLTGTFDFHLQYNGAVPDDRPDDPTRWPPLVFSVKDQLGLELRPTHASVKVLVIDHIDKPDEN